MASTIFSETGLIQRAGAFQSLVFAAGKEAGSKGFVQRAEKFIAKQDGAEFTLLIHNGDLIPSKDQLNQLCQLFQKVYCVNLVEENPSLKALPIGLENAQLSNNGRLSYYLEGLSEPRSSDRSRLVVSSFHPSNNPAVREPTARLFKASRFGFDGHAWKRAEYREVLRQTCFVISPPGNGPDCHRTWEAIYLGAVPVVLRPHLAASLRQDMPILAVDSYEEFLDMSDDSLREQYELLAVRQASKAFAAHWIGEFSR